MVEVVFRWRRRRQVVPSHCVLLGGTEPVLPFPLSPNLPYICDSCEKRTCKLEAEETVGGERETHTDMRERSLGSSCWALIINPHKRDSGSLCPTSLHLTGISHPQPPATTLHSSKKHPLCKFYNHTTAMRDVCVHTVRRDISFYLAYEMSWD